MERKNYTNLSVTPKQKTNFNLSCDLISESFHKNKTIKILFSKFDPTILIIFC